MSTTEKPRTVSDSPIYNHTLCLVRLTVHMWDAYKSVSGSFISSSEYARRLTRLPSIPGNIQQGRFQSDGLYDSPGSWGNPNACANLRELGHGIVYDEFHIGREFLQGESEYEATQAGSSRQSIRMRS